MVELDGAVAVVTGAGSGIGRGIAFALARSGSTVVVVDIEAARAEHVADELRSYGQFHGPGTWSPTADDIPVDGPKVSVDRAASATVGHLTSPTGIYTITD